MDEIVTVAIERLLATSIHTAVLASLVWIIGRCMPRLAPSSLCWLWWLVSLHAIVSLIAGPLELPWLPQATHAPSTSALPASVTELFATGPVVPAWQYIFATLWCCGLLVMLAAGLRTWLYSRRLLANALPCIEPAVLKAAENAARLSRLRKPPRVMLSQRIDSPMLVGHLHPALLLPTRFPMDDQDLQMVLAHELAHLSRGDLWLAVVPALARLLLFFHPSIHLAAREYDIAREAACDAEALSAGDDARQAYGQLLLRLGTAPGQAGLPMASSTFRSLSRRLVLLQPGAYSSRIASTFAIALVLACAVPFRLVEAAAAPEPATRVSDPDDTGQWLAEQTRVWGQRMEEAERRLAEFAQEQRPLSQAELEQRMAELDREREVIRAERARLVERLEQARRSSRPAIESNPTESLAIEATAGNRIPELLQLRQRLTELLLRYNEKHPEVIALRKEISRLLQEQGGVPLPPAR